MEDGIDDGCNDGIDEGSDDGMSDGCCDGVELGETEGSEDGIEVGEGVLIYPAPTKSTIALALDCVLPSSCRRRRSLHKSV